MTQTIQFRRGTAAQWAAVNSILSAAELGLETDTGLFKFGDGNTPWLQLRYAAAPANVLVPSNVGPPTLSGPAVQGQTLNASTGTWTSSPTAFTYAWYQDTGVGGDTLLDGATSASYTLQSTDVGTQIYVQVTASNQYGSGVAISVDTAVVTAAASPVPANTVLPAISGTAQAGSVLTASTGTWSNTPTSYRYQWSNDLGVIVGATSSTYTAQGTDVGHTITVAVWASNANGESPSASSAPTAAVTSTAAAVPANTVAPAISGTAQAGQTLTVSNGTWSNSPTSYTYQWKWTGAGGAAGTAIPGATQQTYVLQASDVGHTLYCAVTATNNGGSGYAYTPATTAVIAAGGGGGGGGGGTVLWAPTFKIGQAPIKGSASEFASTGSNWIGNDVTCVADPLGSGVPVYKFSVPDGDRPSTGHPRADLLSGTGVQELSTVFMSIPIYLPTGVAGVNVGIPLFGTNGTNFCQFAEVKDTVGGGPTWGLEFHGAGGVQCFAMRTGAGTQWSTPVDNAWHTVVMSGVWSRDATKGYFNMWWDGNPITWHNGTTRLPMATLGANPQVGPGPQPLDIDSYRAAGIYTGTMVTYHGRPKIGTTLASVLPDSGLATGP